MNRRSLSIIFLLAWLTAGTLDILGAVFILSKGNASATFRYIANAVTANTASWSQATVLFFGAACHYFIALCWVAVYFIVYKPLRFHKIPIILSSLLYGSLIFLSMRYLFVPFLSTLPAPKPFNSTLISVFIKNIFILSIAFGVTLKLFAVKYYQVKADQKP